MWRETVLDGSFLVFVFYYMLRIKLSTPLNIRFICKAMYDYLRCRMSCCWHFLILTEPWKAAWHRCEKKSLVIAQIRIYTTRISSSISPRSSNPFISEIVLTTVTGETASRLTEEHFLGFLFLSLETITLTLFSSKLLEWELAQTPRRGSALPQYDVYLLAKLGALQTLTGMQILEAHLEMYKHTL